MNNNKLLLDAPTVEQVIEKLQQFPKDAKVVLMDDDGDAYTPLFISSCSGYVIFE